MRPCALSPFRKLICQRGLRPFRCCVHSAQRVEPTPAFFKLCPRNSDENVGYRLPVAPPPDPPAVPTHCAPFRPLPYRQKKCQKALRPCALSPLQKLICRNPLRPCALSKTNMSGGAPVRPFWGAAPFFFAWESIMVWCATAWFRPPFGARDSLQASQLT